MGHFNQKHYSEKLPHGPQLDKILVRHEPETEGNIMTIDNCFQYLGKCNSESGCRMILGASGRIKHSSPAVFGDGHYEMRRKFMRHYDEHHPDQDYDADNYENSFTIVMGDKSEGPKKLWSKKEILKDQTPKTSQGSERKRKRSGDQKSSPPVALTPQVSSGKAVPQNSGLKTEKDQLPVSRVKPATILRCNYCSREICGSDSLDHWNECQPTLDISKLIYTNTETCLNARARDIYGQIGRCTYEQCGHYIGSVNQLLLNKKILNTRFMSHYKKCHDLPEHFNTPQHYTIVNLSEESVNEQVIVKKSSEKKRISIDGTKKIGYLEKKRISIDGAKKISQKMGTESIVCLTCNDGIVINKHVTRHLNTSHAGQDIYKLKFKCTETDRIIGIEEILPGQIIGKCNHCGQFNKVSEHHTVSVLKSVLLTHYRKFHGDIPKDPSTCWELVGGGNAKIGQSSQTNKDHVGCRDSPSNQSPMAKKIKRERSISGEIIENIKRGRPIGEIISNKTPETEFTTPKTSKTKPTTILPSSKTGDSLPSLDNHFCSLCDQKMDR